MDSIKKDQIIKNVSYLLSVFSEILESEKVNVDPYTERGFAGFDHMTPWSPMKR